MTMFKPQKAKSVKHLIEQIDEPRKSEIIKIHKFIQKILPKYKPYLTGNIISYGKQHYKTKAGSEGDWMVIGLASQKNYISLYACAAVDGQYIAEKYKDKLPKANIGKSCIRFKKIDDIDLKVIEKIIKETDKVLKK